MNSCQVKTCISVIFLLGVVFPGILFAQEKGIGVTPAQINIKENINWPYTVPITVTNFSEQEESFEVMGAAANPGRFVLEGGQSRRVLITFEEPAEGVLKVLSLQTSAEGFTTGTGVKIPFSIAGSNDSKFLASANSAANISTYVFGIGILLATIILLWYIADIVKPWLWNSNKQ